MSYKKETISNEKIIRFYYLTDDIFNAASEATAFKAISTGGEKALADFDKIQLAVDEKVFMKKYLKEAALKVFNPLFKIISGTQINHDSPVDTGLTAVGATALVVGKTYEIVSVGTTSFTGIGASANTVGVVFVCTAAGTGTGTAKELLYATYVDITDNERYRTINLDLIDQLIFNALVGFILFKWYFLKGLEKDSQLHLAEFTEYVKEMVDRSLFLRQPA